MVVITPPDTKGIKNNFAEFINESGLFTDPYVQQTGGSRPSASPFATTSPFPMGGAFPKIQVDAEEVSFETITGQTYKDRIEKRTYNINFFYYNKQRHGFTLSGSPFSDEDQTLKYLEIVRDTLKENQDNSRFEHLRRWTFGAIAKPTFVTEVGAFMSFLPLVVDVYTK